MQKLTIDINGICNEKCRFCYQNLDGSMLPENKIYALAQESGANTIEIGGGEPFLDQRIIRIISTLREQGKRANISTNGTVIPNGLLELKKEIKDGIEIQASIHASNPKLYEEITGKDLFNKVMENIEILKENFQLGLTSAIYNDNFHDVPKILELSDRLDLPLRINLVFPLGKGKNVQLLSLRQIDQLQGYLFAQRIERGDRIDSPLIHSNNCYALAKDYGMERKGICPFDCGKLYVSPRGERFGCEFYRAAAGRRTK